MIYPKRNELVKLTGIILGACVAFGAFFALIDTGMQALINLI